MCGIAGIISKDPNQIAPHRLKQMTDVLKHRGPEGEGFWINDSGTVGFGHRRLSIIDLSEAGAQPMHYAGRYTITYNGEIYNYLELKESLQKKGFSFKSHCDTEVVLAAYAFYGKDCLQYFDGMFAFAIWDEQTHSLFCVRDRFGEKPFYYHYNSQAHALLFGSEIKALWAAGIHKETDPSMLVPYLALGWVQNPADKQQTFFKNIYSLPPSHYLLFSKSESAPIEIHQYFDIDKETIKTAPGEELKEKFLDLFTTSIKRRLRSDVAVGSSLSGGLDSSAIVTLIHSLLVETKKQKTFSAVFPGFAKDESAHIHQVVKQYQLENFTVTPTAEEWIKDMESLAWHQDEPFQSSSIYAQYRVYQLAKEHNVTVILDGQGADEILAGYHKYYHWYLQELVANGKWSDAQKALAAAKNNGIQIDWNFKNYVAAYTPALTAKQLMQKASNEVTHNSDLSNQYVQAHFKKQTIYKPVVEKLNDILYFNTMEFGLEELLRYADRNSMAHSREVRLPFLNHELVQFVFSVPTAMKILMGFTKYILRSAMAPTLPQNIVWRKDKVGFEPPQQEWMQHPQVKEYIHESRRKLVHAGVLSKSVLDKPTDEKSAHATKNFDWRYLCATNTLDF